MKKKLKLKEVKEEVASLTKDAVQFMRSEYAEYWNKAERYYNGEVDLFEDENRSKQVATVVRDAVRASMPAIMRKIMEASMPVQFTPDIPQHGAYAKLQSKYATKLFWKNNGYMTLQQAIEESLVCRSGPVKTFYEEDPFPEWFTYTSLTEEDLERLKQNADIEIDKEYEETAPNGVVSYRVEGTRYYYRGRTIFEAFPIQEFFINSGANSVLGASIHGHARSVTVADAIEMGIDYDNWEELNDYDVETAETSEASNRRRGHEKRQTAKKSEELLQHRFFLSEAYVKYDLDGDGVPEHYRFWLGGTSYKYLDHEQIEEWCIDLCNTDPMRFASIGRSMPDILMMDQDTQTSILRAVIDNAHQTNNPRYFADPTRVDFDDLLNNSIGAVVKTNGDIAPRVVDIPFTGSQLIPFLEILRRDAQDKSGSTKASLGLDPRAMQSTDPAAVDNTIKLSDSMIDYMVTNVIYTCIIPVFKKMLRIAQRHADPIILERLNGSNVKIDIRNFDPDLPCEPTIGLGKASPQQQIQTLGFIKQTQEQYLKDFGLDNPFTSLSQLYNTIEDMIVLGGIHDVSRYFNVVTPEMEQKIQKGMAEQAAKAAEQEAQRTRTMDPSAVLMHVEQEKAKLRAIELAAEQASKDKELKLRAIEADENINLKRDELSQKRVLEFAKLRIQRDKEAALKREQASNDTTTASDAANDEGAAPESGARPMEQPGLLNDGQ